MLFRSGLICTSGTAAANFAPAVIEAHLSRIPLLVLKIFEAIRQLKLGVRRNRIVTMRNDELPRPLSRLRRGEGRYVYKQEHCGRCGTELDIYPIAGRTTWSCPACQPR